MFGRGNSMQRDVEYQAGRRVEHVVSQAGAIRRLHVVALVRQPLGEQQRSEVQKLVAAAVGASPDRGDTVVVQSVALSPAVESPGSPKDAAQASPAAEDAEKGVSWIAALLFFAGFLSAGLLWLGRPAASTRPRPLTERERRAALAQVRSWMLQSPPTIVGEAEPKTTGVSR